MITEHESFRLAFVSNSDVAEAILESAIELAWIMSTLLPPSSAYKPTVYYPEWQELVTTSGSTVNPETDTNYKLIYCRPILFFGAEGTVGKPGAVKCLPVGSHISTTDKKNDTSIPTSPLNNEGSDEANCNFQATCKSTTEEVGLEGESRAMKLVSDAREHAANPMEDSETPSYMKEKENHHQLLSSAQNSDPIQFSKDKILQTQ